MRTYTVEELNVLLKKLLNLPHETEWLEFKESYAEPERLGRYISGLSNSACRLGVDYGFLVFGVNDKTHEITGTSFDPEITYHSTPIRMWLKQKLTPEIGFEFYTLFVQGKKVVILQIEAAYRQPVAFEQKEWTRFGSSLTELSKISFHAESIRERLGSDWSKKTVLEATLASLSPEALTFARQQFSEKHKDDSFADEIQNWDDWTFLHRARLAIDGNITNAGLLLLGNPESSHYLNPYPARITWNLIDQEGISLEYHHFEPPFLLAVDKLYAKIRNLTIRTMPDGTLFPIEIMQYDPWVFREALHNCIVHQDYRLCRSTVITEYPDRIIFANAGSFLPETIENALFNNQRPRFYRNEQLAKAMVELKTFRTQQKRFMPMPEYDLSNQEVLMTLWGKILDPRYTRLLIRETMLPLNEIILLDKLQKNKRIQKSEAEHLRKRKLIEGRFPNVFPASEIALKGDKIEEYLETKGLDDHFYMQKILEFLCLKGSASRKEIDHFIYRQLPQHLDEEQKQNKIKNLLSVTMSRRFGWIKNIGGRGNSCWVLTPEGCKMCRKNNPNCKKKQKKCDNL